MRCNHISGICILYTGIFIYSHTMAWYSHLNEKQRENLQEELFSWFKKQKYKWYNCEMKTVIVKQYKANTFTDKFKRDYFYTFPSLMRRYYIRAIYRFLPIWDHLLQRYERSMWRTVDRAQLQFNTVPANMHVYINASKYLDKDIILHNFTHNTVGYFDTIFKKKSISKKK